MAVRAQEGICDTVRGMETTSKLDLASRPKAAEATTRDRISMFDRVKLTVFILAVALVVSFARIEANPVLSWGEALYKTYIADGWVIIALVLEALRQGSFLLAERSRSYHLFWKNTVFGRWNRRVGRLDAWTLYRAQRASRFATVIVLISVALGILQNTSPLKALYSVPWAIWQRLPFIFQIVVYILIAVVQFVAIFWFLSRGGVETYMPNEIQTRFSDIWGQDHVIGKVKESLVFLEQPEIVEKVGGYVPSGILLWGPPGTGKTLIAKAVAGETGKPFVSVEPSAFQAMFVGVGPMKVKALFRKLRKLSLRYGGVIVFFDEADSLGNRGQLAQGGWRPPSSGFMGLEEHERWLSGRTRSMMRNKTAGAFNPGEINPIVVAPGGGGMAGMGVLQALLAEMQGLEKPRGTFFRGLRKLLGMRPKLPPQYRIMYIMATNMPDSLDQALLRPGRIDRIYKVGFPTKEGRKRTYEGYLANVPHELSPAELDKLSGMAPPRTGAEIKDVVNEALIHALKRGATQVAWQDIIHARYIRQVGLPEGFTYVDWERHAVAIHEACHAVAGFHMRPWEPIDVATIERRGDVGGFVSSIDSEEQFSHWRSDLEADICVSLASLAGERYFFGGDNSGGVGGDLRHATAMAYQMLGIWGMGETISSIIGRPGEAIGDLKEGSDKSLDERVETTLRQLYGRVEKLLQDNRHQVLAVAHALETHKTITGEDIKAIIYHTQGTNVDGRHYADEAFMDSIEAHHEAAKEAHWSHDPVAHAFPIYTEHMANVRRVAEDSGEHIATNWPEWWGTPPTAGEAGTSTNGGETESPSTEEKNHE